MPIVTKNNKVVYGRHELPPQREKVAKDPNLSDADHCPVQQTAEEKNFFAVISSSMKDLAYLAVLFIFITVWMYNRHDGMLMKAKSVMSPVTAASYESFIALNTNTTFLSRLNVTNIPISPDSDEFVSHCGDVNSHILMGSKVTVTYALTNANNVEIISPSKPVSFLVNSLANAIETGSTNPLLHSSTLDMCVNQTKIVSITYNPLSNTTKAAANMTLNQYLTTLFPTLVNSTLINASLKQQSSFNIISTLNETDLPLTLTTNVLSVETAEQLKLANVALEEERLRNGDYAAFMRNTIGKIHPLYLLIGYVAVKFGLGLNKRFGRKMAIKKD